MFSLFDLAMEQLKALPSLPRSLFFYLLILFPILHPVVAFFELTRTIALVHIAALATSAAEFSVEFLRLWPRRKAASRGARERVESLWKYVVDSLRWFVVAALCVVLGFSFVAACVTIYALFLLLWGRSDARLTSLLRTMLKAVGFKGISTPSEGEVPEADSRRAAKTPRTTSLKSGSTGRCVVLDEGPHFQKHARGCLLAEC